MDDWLSFDDNIGTGSGADLASMVGMMWGL